MHLGKKLNREKILLNHVSSNSKHILESISSDKKLKPNEDFPYIKSKVYSKPDIEFPNKSSHA